MVSNALIIVGLIVAGTVSLALVVLRSRNSGFVQVRTTDQTSTPQLTGASDREVLELLERGERIAAIKLVRLQRGLGLRQAKEYVEAIEAGRQPLPPAAPSIADPELDATLSELIAQGRKIEAVKLVRERLGLGLKEAVEYVNALSIRQE